MYILVTPCILANIFKEVDIGETATQSNRRPGENAV